MEEHSRKTLFVGFALLALVFSAGAGSGGRETRIPPEFYEHAGERHYITHPWPNEFGSVGQTDSEFFWPTERAGNLQAGHDEGTRKTENGILSIIAPDGKAYEARILLSVICPFMCALFFYSLRVFGESFTASVDEEEQPTLDAFFLGLILSQLLLLIVVFALNISAAFVLLPPLPYIGALFVAGMIIVIRFEPEITGNIIVDSALMSMGILAGGLFLSISIMLMAASLFKATFSHLLFFILAWMALSFFARIIAWMQE